MNKIDKKESIVALLIIVSLALGAANLYQNLTAPKVGFVKSQELIYGYLGTQEAQKSFSAKREALKANVDSLKSELENSVRIYNTTFNTYSQEEQRDKKQNLQFQQDQFLQYAQSVETKIEQEDKLMMEGILNQVNSYIEEYGQEKGYDLILGSTTSGNILYGLPKHDVTEDLLNRLNKSYKGE